MQKITIKVPDDIEINVNIKNQPRQNAAQSYFSPEFVKTLQQFGKMLQQNNRKGNVLSDEEENGVFEFAPEDGVLFNPLDTVMVINPEFGASSMTVKKSQAILDIFKGNEVIFPFPLINLKMSCKPDSIARIENRNYLTGTAIVFADVDGCSVSLNPEDIHLVKRIMETQCETIVHGGQRIKALRF